MFQLKPSPQLSATVILGGKKFFLAVASSSEERARGYMFRKTINPREGILFIYPDEAQRTFWMKNVYIPLDILFLDKKFEILEIIPQAPPEYIAVEGSLGSSKTYRKNRSSNDPGPFKVTSQSQQVRYVLEIKGGTSTEVGLKKGETLTISF